MKKLKQLLNLIIITLINTPIMVLADSGLDSNYKESSSVVGSIISVIMQCFSPIVAVLTEKPGSKDYLGCHIAVGVVCLLILVIVILIYQFKIDKKKETKAIIKIGISLIPTIIFGLICFLTKLYLFVYILILLIYIIPYIIICNTKIKEYFKEEVSKLNFKEEEFSKEAFDIYKDLQLAWCDFNLNKVKNIISDELYDNYSKKLDELKNNNKKNIMNDIELKSNKIKDIIVKDDIISITCDMEVECFDYIINDKDEVTDGKKDKKYNYKYKLVFSKNIKDKKYKLISKKIKNIKIAK